jgi:hypothetical protein
MRLAYNDSMSPVEKFRYDRNLHNAASRHALDFANFGALERFRTKWMPRAMKRRQNKNLKSGF